MEPTDLKISPRVAAGLNVSFTCRKRTVFLVQFLRGYVKDNWH